MGSKRLGLLANTSEERLLEILEHLGGYSVFTKVRLTDVLDDRDYPWDSVQREFMRKAHLDFVLTEPTGLRRFVAAIELDGPSHSDHAQQRRDDLKDEICREAGLPLFRFTHPGIDECMNMDWVAHVLECWKWDLRNQREQGSKHFPLCWFIAANKHCYLRNGGGGRSLAVEVLECESYECPTDGCDWAGGTARVRIVASDQEAVGTGSTSRTTLPLTCDTLTWLAIDLAEYHALKQLRIAHWPCGLVAPHTAPIFGPR